MYNEYHIDACDCEDCNTIVAINLNRYDTIIDKIAQDLHAGKLKPEDLNQELVNQTYADLNEASENGYGKNWNTFPADGKGATPTRLKQNLYAFSSAKTYAQVEAINRLLVDADGKLRPYNEFEQLAKKTGLLYNKNYLQAEYQTARTSAQMIDKWERLQETKDLFPNLKFRTVGDDRVRDKHRALNGIVKPIDDKFWDKYYPPLDWRCRCDVVATAEDADDKLPKDLPEPQLKEHVGKSQEIFTKKGTYFKLANTKENVKRNMELVKLNAPYEQGYKAKNGKKIEVNIFADEKDLIDNIESAKLIVDQLNLTVQIRPHLDTNIAIGLKNAEYYINNNISDLKSNFKENNYQSINNAFKAAKKQGLTSIVFNFTKSFKDLDIHKVNREILSNINENQGSKYNEIIFIYNSKAIRVNREIILKKELIKELEKLKANS